MNRRTFIKAALAAGVGAATSSYAGEYPDRPIVAISPFTPGGMTEAFFRPIWNLASPRLGQNVAIEYKPGASGGVAASLMANTKPDGYTLLHYYSTLLIVPYMEAVNYNPVRDFTYIIALADVVYGVAVAANSPYRTLNELIDAARRKPRSLTYGIAGLGTGGHIAWEEIMHAARAEMTAVPYKGVEANTAVIGGHIDASVGSMSWAPLVSAGKLKMLALFSRERLKNFPDVPTAKELGFGAADPFPMGVVGPKGMSPTIVKVLHDALKSALDTTEMEKIMVQRDTPKLYMGSEEFQKWAMAAFAKKGAVLKNLGLAKHTPGGA